MSIVKWAKNRINRNRRSRRAISTIMANLTMLIIVVFLSAMLFVWAISSFGIYQGGAGYWFSSRSLANQERISVENVYFTCASGSCANSGSANNIVKIYIRNVGSIPFKVASIYVNGTLYSLASPININVTQVCPVPTCLSTTGLTLTGQSWTHNDIQTIKVATLRGTVQTSQWVS
jgi:FlaG/FlaF family flagellin (archaellin)